LKKITQKNNISSDDYNKLKFEIMETTFSYKYLEIIFSLHKLIASLLCIKKDDGDIFKWVKANKFIKEEEENFIN
jgi:hypothetical protein